MIISMAVHGAPAAGSAVSSALKFATAALQAGHQIRQVFFYHDGVRAADALSVMPQGEQDSIAGWVALQQAHDLELTICIAAALKRGILNDTERARYERSAASLHPAFQIVGLGQLIDAIATSDRFVTFAA